MKTRIQIINTILSSLLTDNLPSYNGSNCAYRGDEGRKCLVGRLIDDDQYNPVCEDSSVYGVYTPNMNETQIEKSAVLSKSLVASGVDVKDQRLIDMLRKIQTFHDDTLKGLSIIENEGHLHTLTRILNDLTTEWDTTLIDQLHTKYITLNQSN